MVMQLSIIWIYILIAYNLEELLDVFHMGNFRSDIGGCTKITDEYFKLLAPLYIWFHLMKSPRELFLSEEHLVTSVSYFPPFKILSSIFIIWLSSMEISDMFVLIVLSLYKSHIKKIVIKRKKYGVFLYAKET